jgi:hypothetical protein
MATFDQIADEVKRGLLQLLAQEGQSAMQAALSDGAAFLQDTRADLERWAQLLASGQLTKDDFASLVRGRQDLAQMAGLKRVGLAAIRIEQIKTALIQLIITAAGKVA